MLGLWFLTPRLLMFGAFALALTVAATSLYVKGRNDGWNSLQAKIERQDARSIKIGEEAKRSASKPGSFDRLRKRYPRNK